MPIQQICEPKLCTACFACMRVCPKGAISKVLNSLGEEMPSVDPEKCVDCGLCISLCPTNNKPNMQRAGYCYAAWSKSEDDLLKSSSGGIGTVLSLVSSSKVGLCMGQRFRKPRYFM